MLENAQELRVPDADGRLRAYARALPSQGGAEIGDILEELAAGVSPDHAIVEVGCWLGAGTARLAIGQREGGAPIHVYDRWTANSQEIEKAARYGINLKLGEDTLPIVRDSLAVFDANIFYHRGDIRKAVWELSKPIGLYVDDATKVEEIWQHAVDTFFLAFVPNVTHLVLMDFHFYEKAGERYAAQKRYIEKHSDSFAMIADRCAGTTAAVFRYLG